MRKMLFGTAELGDYPIRYYLLAESTESGRDAYGVQVEYRGAEITFSDITPSPRKIRTLLGLLQRGTVTPVAVRDVVEDWLLTS